MQQRTNHNVIWFGLCSVAIIGFCFFSVVSGVRAQSGVPYTVDIVATVPGCGDGVIQTGEQCDGSTLGGASCSSLGFSSGPLSCSSVCTHITTACVLTPPVTSASTRVIERQVVSAQAHIVVTGYASPGVAVTLLKDGQPVGVAVPDETGSFQITVAGVAEGNHQLQIVSILRNSIIRSEAITARVMKETTTRIGNIIMPPHFERITNEAGQIIVQGIGIPGATIVVDGSFGYTKSITVDQSGAFTSFIPSDSGSISMTTIYRNIRSSVQLISPTLIPETYDQEVASCVLFVDQTSDCRVNILDFTQALQAFFFKTKSEQFDFDKNGQVDIVDFSIMAYYWTG